MPCYCFKKERVCMGLIRFFSIVFFIFTMILMVSQKRTGKLFVYFGCMTFVLVLSFGYAPQMHDSWQKIDIFVIFSCLLLLIYLMNGIICLYFLHLPHTVSQFLSITFLFALMVILFNVQGFLTYMYIPVLSFLIFKKLVCYKERIAQRKFTPKRAFRSRNEQN